MSERAKVADRLPPHSPPAEEGVLGCILLSPLECLAESQMRLRAGPEAFYDLRHQLIYRALLGLEEKHEAIDIITLQQRLKDLKLLEEIGGIAYLASLTDAVPSAANFAYYADIVQEKYLLRQIIKVCTESVGAAFEYEGEAQSLLNSVERDVLAIRMAVDTGDGIADNRPVMESLWNDYERAVEQGRPLGMQTGLADLDDIIGGIEDENYVIIGANPSAGKTALMMNIFEKEIFAGVPCMVFSLEMSRKELIHRMACTVAEVDGRKLQNGTASKEEKDRVAKAMVKISKSPLYIDDSSGLTLPKLQSKCRLAVKKYGIKRFGMDYFQLANSGRKCHNKNEDGEYLSSGIKQLAKELKTPFIVPSQLNRDNKREERRPGAQDLRGCGSLEQDADKIFLLHIHPKTGVENEYPKVDIIVAKNRGGATDTCTTLFIKEFTQFRSIDRFI